MQPSRNQRDSKCHLRIVYEMVALTPPPFVQKQAKVPSMDIKNYLDTISMEPVSADITLDHKHVVFVNLR